MSRPILTDIATLRSAGEHLYRTSQTNLAVEVARAADELAQLRVALSRMTPSATHADGHPFGDMCRYCGGRRITGKHDPDCAWIVARQLIGQGLEEDR